MTDRTNKQGMLPGAVDALPTDPVVHALRALRAAHSAVVAVEWLHMGAATRANALALAQMTVRAISDGGGAGQVGSAGGQVA